MKRFLTGMILMPTGVYVIIAGNLPLYGLILIMGSIALYECHSMMKHPNHWYFLCALTGFIAWVSNIHFSHINGTQLICLGLISILFYAVSGIELLNKKLIGMNRPILLYVKSVIYVSTGFSALIFLRQLPYGIYIVGFSLTTIWFTDIFSLIGGRLFGRTSYSVLSPNKTVEGLIIGLGTSVFINVCLVYYFELSPLLYIIIGLSALFAQIGDLYESLIKRQFKIKDTSNFLPGHGGVLDRADSTLYVFPLILLIQWLMP